VAQPMLWEWVDCMTLTDRATRLRVVLPLKNKRHVTVKAQLGRLLAAQGRPIKRILCDQEFKSEELEEWCLDHAIDIRYRPEREPESNGIAESSVRLLKEAGRTPGGCWHGSEVSRAGMGACCAAAQSPAFDNGGSVLSSGALGRGGSFSVRIAGAAALWMQNVCVQTAGRADGHDQRGAG